MPLLTCRNCGEITNTAVCDYMHSKDDLADRCFIMRKDNKWQKGCAYDAKDNYIKDLCDELIEGK